MAPPVRVLLVDDSPLALTLLQRMLAGNPDIQVVGTATDGQQALEMIPRLVPQVVCTDYHMPGMDGLALTREIMARHPRPILIVSSTIDATNTARVFPLLEAGAVDVFPKPAGAPGPNSAPARQFAAKITLLASVPVSSRAARRAASSAPTAAVSVPITITRPRIVGIGASTGGPQALQVLLSGLPATFPVPLVCVQHISPGFLRGMLDWLASQCSVRIEVARNGVKPEPGVAYFAEEQTHLTVDDTGRLRVSQEAPVGGHRPSVTVTLESIARHFGAASVGVLLTGMGSDGADGMAAIAQAGGVTIAQDEATSVVFGMPRQAIERGAARYVLPLERISNTLIGRVSGVDTTTYDAAAAK